MRKDHLTLSILIIEDNHGDFVLLEDYLHEKFEGIQIWHVVSYESALEKFKSQQKFDIILLDLVLPDLQGETLALKVQQHTKDIPIIILTGYTDIDIARKILSLGVSDFLIKDEINPEILYKSIVYAIERKTYIDGINKTKKTYQDLFNLSPQPMWLFDITSLKFLDVNQAAISKYGYTSKEFLKMTIKDIRPKDQVKFLENTLTNRDARDPSGFAGVFIHKLKSGADIYVEIFSSKMEYNDKVVRLVLANDVTEKLEYIKKIEAQNLKLKNIAWTQSHIVRAPLSRILGIISLLELEDYNSEDLPFLMDKLKASGNELDKIVQGIVQESNDLDLDSLFLDSRRNE